MEAQKNKTGELSGTNIEKISPTDDEQQAIITETTFYQSSSKIAQPIASEEQSLFKSIEQSIINTIEAEILKAARPLEFNETELLTVNGETGYWVNKAEALNWKGVIPISNYSINEDSNPEIIRKHTEHQLIYDQEVAIRYLRPSTPQPPGEIIIRQEKNIAIPPAPPLVIRQQPPRPETPPPLIIREAPPKALAAVGQKIITISGKKLPPPPRKVVIERLAPLPSKPQALIVERWLPYTQQKRKVIFQKNQEADSVVAKPKNVIIQWDPPAVQVKKNFKDLGVIRANPAEYVQRYGATLKAHNELPQFVKEIKPPTGVVLAAEYNQSSLFELEGDIHALSLIDLEREGLGEYKAYLAKLTQSSVSTTQEKPVNSIGILNAILLELFQSVDTDATGSITLAEAEGLLLRLNSRLGRKYGDEDAKKFFKSLDMNGDGIIDFEEFKNALLKTMY